MELFLFIYLIIFVVVPIVGAAALISSILSKTSAPAHKQCEKRVSNALRDMDMKSYVVFDNLVLRSGGNTSHTEIDHVVVSPYGIFCIETKSHQGSIYGSMKGKYWTQYLGNKSYSIYNPFRQNYKHIRALENLLGSNVKAPIHSYVIFPNARNIQIDDTKHVGAIEHVLGSITRHQTQIYNLAECEKILKTLAYASSNSESLLAQHQKEVRAYVSTI